MAEKPARRNSIGALITSLLGALTLLAGDFAVWEERVLISDDLYSYPKGYIGLLEGPAYFVVIGGFGVLLLLAAWASYRGLRSTDEPLPRRWLQLGFWGATAACLASLIGGVVFLVVMAIDEPYDWWLDWGFYGGVVFGGLAAVFLWLEMRSVKG